MMGEILMTVMKIAPMLRRYVCPGSVFILVHVCVYQVSWPLRVMWSGETDCRRSRGDQCDVRP